MRRRFVVEQQNAFSFYNQHTQGLGSIVRIFYDHLLLAHNQHTRELGSIVRIFYDHQRLTHNQHTQGLGSFGCMFCNSVCGQLPFLRSFRSFFLRERLTHIFHER